MSSQFLEANFNGGLQAPHYFNGRLLSAEDLQADQSTTLAHESWLGKASGYGVIEGLMVTQIRGTTTVQITAGIGLNHMGQPIRLSNDIILPLIPQPTDANAANRPVNDPGRFTSCDAVGPTSGNGGNSAAGAYLLTVLPVSRFEGQAAVISAAGNGSSSTSAGCGSKWEVEGIQFKTIPLTGFVEWVNGIVPPDGADLNTVRNLLAHWCYGSPAQSGLVLDPFHFPASFGAIDLLPPADLTPCDLPLAVFYWTGDAVAFVDAWSARRRLVQPDALVEVAEQPLSSNLSGGPQDFPSPLSGSNFPRTWKGMLSDQRVVVAQARFLQFQDHVQQLVDERKANGVVMKDYFRFLPPVSFLPVTLDSLLNLVGPPTSSAAGTGTQQAPQATSNPFLSELTTLLQARQAAVGLVNRGVDSFDYGRFFNSKQYFWIGSRLNNFVLDVQGVSTNPAIPIVSNPRNDPPTDNQLWSFEDGHVISKLNGYVLTGTNKEVIRTDRGTWFQLTVSPPSYPQTLNQQWSIDPDGCLVSAFNGYVADIEFSDVNAKTPVISYQKNTPVSNNQRWYLDPYVVHPGTNAGVPFVINQALVEGAGVASLLQQSWYDNAIDLAQLYSSTKASFPLLNVYFVRENLANPSSPPYVVVVRAARPFAWSIPPQ